MRTRAYHADRISAAAGYVQRQRDVVALLERETGKAKEFEDVREIDLAAADLSRLSPRSPQPVFSLDARVDGAVRTQSQSSDAGEEGRGVSV